MLVLAARALVLRRTRVPEAWRGGWGAGVVLVVFVAFEPSMIIFAVLVGMIGADRAASKPAQDRPDRHRARGAAGGVAAVVADPDLGARDGCSSGPIGAGWGDRPPPRLAAAARAGVGPGLPPLWVGAVIFGVSGSSPFSDSLAGLPDARCWRRGRLRWSRSAMAVVLSRLVVAVPPAGTEVRPWVGSYLLLGFAALIVSGGWDSTGSRADMRERSFSWLQPASVLAGVAVWLVSVGGAVWWVLAGAMARSSGRGSTRFRRTS